MKKNLAIKGHPTRGKEVIELLEMLGGKNIQKWDGKAKDYCYIINSSYSNEIECLNAVSDAYRLFILEEFLSKFPYKVGDKVNYVKYNDEYPSAYTIQRMRWTGATIEYLLDSSGFSALTKDLQPYKEETMEEKNNNNWAKWDLPDGYEFQDEEGNVIKTSVIKLVKKQPQYPKTYVECAEILLERASVRNDIGYKGDLLINLQRLLICRDAYWFIYNNWKPTHKSGCDNTIYTIHRFNDEVIKGATSHRHSLLEFPTEEMRDEFYENFKTLIFACKELI